MRDPEAEPMTRRDWKILGVIIFIMAACAFLWLFGGLL